MIKTFGEWTIDVDIEATKQYYHNLQIEKEIIDFEEKCSTEEQSFLNELGVDTHKITLKQVQDWNNSDDTIMKKYKVQFLVVGTFKEMPEIQLKYYENLFEIPLMVKKSCSFQIEDEDCDLEEELDFLAHKVGNWYIKWEHPYGNEKGMCKNWDCGYLCCTATIVKGEMVDYDEITCSIWNKFNKTNDREKLIQDLLGIEQNYGREQTFYPCLCVEIGDAYCKNKEYEKAMPYLTYAEKYIEITPGIDEITICYWLSYMYMLEGNDLLKEKYKKQMESICDNIEEALAFRNLGMIV